MISDSHKEKKKILFHHKSKLKCFLLLLSWTFPGKYLRFISSDCRRLKISQPVYLHYLCVFPRRVFSRRVWFPSESVPPRPVLVLRQKRQDVCVLGEFERRHEKCAQQPLSYINMFSQMHLWWIDSLRLLLFTEGLWMKQFLTCFFYLCATVFLKKYLTISHVSTKTGTWESFTRPRGEYTNCNQYCKLRITVIIHTHLNKSI